MKIKGLFYISFSICLLQFIIWFFFPFGGIYTVVSIIKEGLFLYKPSGKTTQNQINLQHILSSAGTFIYFLSVLSGCIFPLFYKLKNVSKFKITIISALLSILILVSVKIVNTF
jgi:hypothetical protein